MPKSSQISGARAPEPRPLGALTQPVKDRRAWTPTYAAPSQPRPATVVAAGGFATIGAGLVGSAPTLRIADPGKTSQALRAPTTAPIGQKIAADRIAAADPSSRIPAIAKSGQASARSPYGPGPDYLNPAPFTEAPKARQSFKMPAEDAGSLMAAPQVPQGSPQAREVSIVPVDTLAPVGERYTEGVTTGGADRWREQHPNATRTKALEASVKQAEKSADGIGGSSTGATEATAQAAAANVIPSVDVMPPSAHIGGLQAAGNAYATEKQAEAVNASIDRPTRRPSPWIWIVGLLLLGVG